MDSGAICFCSCSNTGCFWLQAAQLWANLHLPKPEVASWHPPLPLSDLIHDQLELSRIERFSDSLMKAVAKTPGTIGDCPYRGRIMKRACIGSSTSDSGTRLVTIDVQGEGLSFSSGDHLLVSALRVRLFVSFNFHSPVF